MYFDKLFTKYAEWKIIDFFLDNPSQEFYLNQIARELKISPGTVSGFMKSIEKDNIFIKKTIGNLHLYKINLKSKLVKQLLALKKVRG